MADKNKETTNGTPEINEADIIEVKTPWWKWPLKIGGYILSALAGAATVILVNSLGGDDDDDVEAADSSAAE